VLHTHVRVCTRADRTTGRETTSTCKLVSKRFQQRLMTHQLRGFLRVPLQRHPSSELGLLPGGEGFLVKGWPASTSETLVRLGGL
jgi:hypothetical protein